MDELIDEIDNLGKTIATHPKSYLKERMFLHKVCLVIPKSSENELILSKRAKDKHPFPDTWCCAVGGKISSGESEESAAMREMKEEVGMTFPIVKVAQVLYDEKDYKGLFNIFTSSNYISIKDFILDAEEIQYSKSFKIDELKELINKHPDNFAPTFLAVLQKFLTS